MHFSVMEVTFMVPLGVEDYLSKRIYLASIRVFNKNEVLDGGRAFVFFLLL